MDKYKLGSDINLKFGVKVEGKPASVRYAKLDLYDRNTFVARMKAKVEGNSVSAQIPHKNIEKKGKYKALFTMQLSEYGQQQHSIEFNVVPVIGDNHARNS